MLQSEYHRPTEYQVRNRIRKQKVLSSLTKSTPLKEVYNESKSIRLHWSKLRMGGIYFKWDIEAPSDEQIIAMKDLRDKGMWFRNNEPGLFDTSKFHLPRDERLKSADLDDKSDMYRSQFQRLYGNGVIGCEECKADPTGHHAWLHGDYFELRCKEPIIRPSVCKDVSLRGDFRLMESINRRPEPRFFPGSLLVEEQPKLKRECKGRRPYYYHPYK